MTSKVSSNTQDVRKTAPVAFDPSCPSKLAIFDQKDMKLHELVSHGGISCNQYERSALGRIILEHGVYYSSQRRSESERDLSRVCRTAVIDCLESWEASLVEEESKDASSIEKEGKQSKEDDFTNLELLKLSLAVMHLSDIFLPLLKPHHTVAAEYRLPFQKQGVVTAPLVRFLRYHFNSPPLVHPDVPDMLQAQQPETFGEDSEEEEELLYWRYIEACVIRGCLDQAWEALERHSLFQNALSMLESQADNVQAQNIARSFHLIRLLFQVAPLPGGRTDAFDMMVYLERDQISAQYEEQVNDSHDYDIFSYLRVAPQDFGKWELPGSEDLGGQYSSLSLSTDAALQKHQDWQQFILQTIRPEFPFHFLPEMRRIFDILVGKLDAVSFLSWPDELCAFLLYKSPGIKPGELPVLAMQVMKKHAEGENDDDEEEEEDCDVSNENKLFVSIMEGQASEAIEALHSLGGGSGAALPSTLLAVIYTLYLDSNILAPDSGFLHSEFLCQAAMDIVSSLKDPGCPDLAVSLALQLLLPHLRNEADSLHVDEIRMCMVHILEHYYPISDAGVKDVLQLIKSVVPTNEGGAGNILPLFEAGEAMVLCRYRHYMDKYEPSLAFLLLMQGIEFRSDLGDIEGVCYRTLRAVCNSYTNKLLQIMTGTQPEVEHDHQFTLQDAEAIVHVIQDQPALSGTFSPKDIEECKVLYHVLELLRAFLLDRDNGAASKQIVACLEERRDSYGKVGSLLPLSLHWPVLLVAAQVIRQEGPLDVSFSSVFDPNGISCLMRSLEQVTNISNATAATKTTWGSSDEAVLREMRELFAMALSDAFVVVNAKKKQSEDTRDKSSLRYTDLAKLDLVTQEAVVQNMLDM